MYSSEFDFIQILLVSFMSGLNSKCGDLGALGLGPDSPDSIPPWHLTPYILRLLAFAYISIFPLIFSYL